jgi:branched-subunit amino acid aminotransferase/4-amino-4-deoxychorismate lyase
VTSHPPTNQEDRDRINDPLADSDQRIGTGDQDEHPSDVTDVNATALKTVLVIYRACMGRLDPDLERLQRQLDSLRCASAEGQQTDRELAEVRARIEHIQQTN